MKILIASGIHGSEFYLQKLLQRFAEEGAEQLVLLGDKKSRIDELLCPQDVERVILL